MNGASLGCMDEPEPLSFARSHIDLWTMQSAGGGHRAPAKRGKFPPMLLPSLFNGCLVPFPWAVPAGAASASFRRG
jgi:hypothetical protein